MISQKRAFEIVEIGQADDRTSRFCDIFFFHSNYCKCDCRMP